MDQETLLQLAKMHSTPFVVVDHKVLRENYAHFRKHLPRVQVYYAVKANSAPAIVQTFYDVGASFDVASVAVYRTYSGVIFDHCQYHLQSFREVPTQLCSVLGPTCDALDTISLAAQLPNMDLVELVYSENMGAYCAASSTFFNGFPPAKVVHMYQ
jgi:ornithine decarboxylase